MTTTLACLLGGLTVITISAPRYEGRARVVLDYIRPDPNTGAVIPSKMLDAYIASQIKLIRDVQVTGPAVEALGWLDSPDVQASYAARDPSDTRDMQSWLGAQLGASAGARMVEGSNIMEIVYVGSSPELTQAVVDVLRASYVQSDVTAKRNAAVASAEAIAARIETVKVALVDLERLQNRLEDETGLTMGAAGRDEEAARLKNLLRVNSSVPKDSGVQATASVNLLRELDAEIAQASGTLGVNNPRLLDMRQRRIALQAQVSVEATQKDSAVVAVEMGQAALASMIEQQKAKVLAVREPTLRLRLMQDEINMKRDSLESMAERLVGLRELSAITASQVSPVGAAESLPEPVFPNIPLILGGAGGLGLVLGILVAFLAELMGRRVRAAADLEAITGVPVLAAIPDIRRRPLSRPKPNARAAPEPVALAAE